MHICKMRKYASYVTLYIYTHAPYLQNVHIRSQEPATQQDSLIACERQLSILSFALDCSTPVTEDQTQVCDQRHKFGSHLSGISNAHITHASRKINTAPGARTNARTTCAGTHHTSKLPFCCVDL
ncbi:hypothetical protein NP493_694g01000 [Ridgeia piscesae]|uniref:Uncharacterized protein n=1 Tax=Ridgeia piscesae TaxID=27915 RepID=A0AAD9KR08_RIDPI|nr:hypothetical protein NP493_694g01000 [Ridgeia piscesae]